MRCLLIQFIRLFVVVLLVLCKTLFPISGKTLRPVLMIPESLKIFLNNVPDNNPDDNPNNNPEDVPEAEISRSCFQEQSMKDVEE